MDTHTDAHMCACMHTHKIQRQDLSSCQMNEKDTTTTLRKILFPFVCVLAAAHGRGVHVWVFLERPSSHHHVTCQSEPPHNTAWHTHPGTTLNFTRFRIKIKSRRRFLSFPSHPPPSKSPGCVGRCTPLQRQRRPASQPGSFRIPTNLQAFTASHPLLNSSPSKRRGGCNAQSRLAANRLCESYV